MDPIAELSIAPIDMSLSFHPSALGTDWPVLVCLLGDFELLKRGRPVALRGGGKAEELLCTLALRRGYFARNDVLRDALWPRHESSLAGQSLNSLIYNLHKLLGDAIDGAAPILNDHGYCHLNTEAGVRVDIGCFDALVREGNQEHRAGNLPAAVACYRRATGLYRADLCAGLDVQHVIERERLRGEYLWLLAYLAEYHHREGQYDICLHDVVELLTYDPCREDAHRLLMRCYARLGQRTQALRQYRLCEKILRAEFDARPEAATTELFDQLRLQPDTK
jgi:DNA-binding SARP family transcriptional activator